MKAKIEPVKCYGSEPVFRVYAWTPDVISKFDKVIVKDPERADENTLISANDKIRKMFRFVDYRGEINGTVEKLHSVINLFEECMGVAKDSVVEKVDEEIGKLNKTDVHTLTAWAHNGGWQVTYEGDKRLPDDAKNYSYEYFSAHSHYKAKCVFKLEILLGCREYFLLKYKDGIPIKFDTDKVGVRYDKCSLSLYGKVEGKLLEMTNYPWVRHDD